MKKLIVFFTYFLISLSTFSESKIAFADLQEIFRGFYKTQLAQDQILQQAEEVKLERELMLEDVEIIRLEVEELREESRDERLNNEARTNKRLQLEDKLIEMQKLQQEVVEYEKLRSKQIDEQNNRMQNKLLDEIQNAIVEFAKENSYEAIIDRSSKSGNTGTDNILFVGSRNDVTLSILDRLNKNFNEPLENDS